MHGENKLEGSPSRENDATPLLPHVTRGIANLDALASGTLVEERGCLFLDNGEGEPLLLVWPRGFQAARTDDRLVVTDASGEVFAEVGQPVSIGGGHVMAKHVGTFSEPDATGLCGASKYWLVSSTPVDA
ncbi:MAG: hypothetical protein L0206_00925 [Actinobacteria bacterium]|nr:hypothetical protein [Actinomycetota bacterium]